MFPLTSRAASPLTRAAILVAVAGLALSSCSSDGQPATTASLSPSPTSTVSVPAGATVTDQGTDLSFGDTATVVHDTGKVPGTVLQLTVKSATKGSTKDFSAFILDDYTKAATPYYVKVAVKNLGPGDIGGSDVPLWGVDAKNTLLPAAGFTTSFTRCPSEKLPKPFGTGATFDTCLVYLAPDGGTLQSVSYRPDQAFDPIQWSGDITTPSPKPKKKQ